MATMTHTRVADMAQHIEAAPSELFTQPSGNPKTDKSAQYGWYTLGLMLSPWKASGKNFCAWATKGCIAACLNTAGQGKYSKTQIARIRKSKWFVKDKTAFMRQIEKEIARGVKSADRKGMKFCVRMNVVQDLPWEKIVVEFSNGFIGNIFDRFPDVQFYDYTKNPNRWDSIPANYDLTFSAAESNGDHVDAAIARGERIAMVFRNSQKPTCRAANWELPSHYKGVPIIDGDKHDLRHTDPKGCIIGLKAKGLACHDKTGFVRDIDPA